MGSTMACQELVLQITPRCEYYSAIVLMLHSEHIPARDKIKICHGHAGYLEVMNQVVKAIYGFL